MATKENSPKSPDYPETQALADLMADADKSALNIDALLLLTEDAAWSMANHIINGHICTLEDNARVAALHAAIEMMRRDFKVIQSALEHGGQFITARASGRAAA